MPYNFRTYVASALRYSSTTRAVDLSIRDRHGLPASGSAAVSRITALADTISKRTHVRAYIYSKLRLRIPRFGWFWADDEPIMARIAQSRVKWARTDIVYTGSPGSTLATTPAMTVACANNAEVLDRLL
ncbi:hypothetical protein EDB86DRAFT_3084108 [Lactarius hatsudake]|nr:hypothetical protein EDB86DRAFT_3084108 [Lactarius hatsudake]